MERFGVLLIPAVLIIGLAQIVLGYWGLDYLIGFWGAIIVGALSLMFRFMLPFTVGAYFGAVEVLEWPVWAGVLAALPGLLLIVPGVIATAIGAIFSKR